MRCQCGFNSFDHHLVCPKCRKDLTATRRLLNLDLPAPGLVNFFQAAGQVMAPPFPGAAGGSEDFGEDLQPLEEIWPINHGANQSPPLEKISPTRPGPGLTAFEAVLEEIIPAPSQALADPVEEPENEIIDDFEIDRVGNRPRPEVALTSAKPVLHHHAFMDQIKSALTETGDLNPEKEYPGPGGRDGTSRASNQAGASGGDEGDDLSSLLGDLNLDELDREL